MYKNRNITDFFKPFAQPRTKRPLPEDDPEETIAVAQPRLAPAKIKSQPREPTETSDLPEDLLKPSSQLSLDDKADSPLSSALSSAPPTDASNADGSDEESTSTPTRAQFDPPSSQTPVLASSQRVVKNGEVVIRNSDDESDSDASLDDIDDILTAHKPPARSSPPTENDMACIPTSGRATGGNSNGKKRKTRATDYSDDPFSSTLPVVPKYKFSLETLVAQARKDDAAEATFAHAQSLLSRPGQYDIQGDGARDKQGLRSAAFGGKLDAGLMATVMKEQGEENDIEKLMSAMQRTEALSQAKVWSFFDAASSRTIYELPAIPVRADQGSWQNVFKVPNSCQQAFLSGYVAEIAAQQTLPDEILLWIVDSVGLEPRDDLRYAYNVALKDAAKQVRPLLTPCRINMLFEKLGASADGLNLKLPAVPVTPMSEPKPRDTPKNDWRRLISVLELIASTAENMNADSRTYAVCLLCRLLLDHSIIDSCDVIFAVEDAIANLLDSIPETELDQELPNILTTIHSSTTEPQLRLQILRNLPASSPRLNLVRRRLAMAFFFEDPAYLAPIASSLSSLPTIIRHLRTSQFDIHHTTDYATLSANISILNIGLDDGDPPPLPSTSLFSSNTTTDGNNKDPRTSGTAFNKAVDRLAHRVHTMFTSIVDTGASHMTRTEAKDVLEAFHARLVYAVRTKQKPKVMLFGDASVELQAGGNLMKQFLARSKPKEAVMDGEGDV